LRESERELARSQTCCLVQFTPRLDLLFFDAAAQPRQ
jgi:hypothetical protein